MLLVSGAFVLAAAVGLVRNAIIARQFGIGAALDAYYAAFKLPDLLFTIVAGGALATAFIPVFTGLLALDDREGAWRLASAITNWVMLITSGLALVVAIAAPWLVSVVIAPGFDAAQTAETVAVMRVVLISTVIFGISSLQGSVLHGFKHFLLPALAPVVYSIGIIIGAVWLAPRWGVLGLAIGAVIGSVFHLAIKIPGLIRFGFRWWPILHAGQGGVRRVVVLMIPRVLDLGVFHLTLLATTNLASRLGAGSVSALEWGWDAMQLPETIIGTAFGLVAFPTLADLAARGDRDGLRDTLTESLRTVLTVAVPAAVGLIVLGRPLLALLYQRGAFDAQATEAVYVASVLLRAGPRRALMHRAGRPHLLRAAGHGHAAAACHRVRRPQHRPRSDPDGADGLWRAGAGELAGGDGGGPGAAGGAEPPAARHPEPATGRPISPGIVGCAHHGSCDRRREQRSAQAQAGAGS